MYICAPAFQTPQLTLDEIDSADEDEGSGS